MSKKRTTRRNKKSPVIDSIFVCFNGQTHTHKFNNPSDIPDIFRKQRTRRFKKLNELIQQALSEYGKEQTKPSGGTETYQSSLDQFMLADWPLLDLRDAFEEYKESYFEFS